MASRAVAAVLTTRSARLWSRLAITGAYDYAQFRRTYADDTIDLPVPVDFYQPDTDTSTFMVSVDEKWSEHFDTYVRMKFINTAYPLYGITPVRERTWTRR